MTDDEILAAVADAAGPLLPDDERWVLEEWRKHVESFIDDAVYQLEGL